MPYEDHPDGWHVVIYRGVQKHHTSYSDTDPMDIMRRIIQNWGGTGMGKVSRITLSQKTTKIHIPDMSIKTENGRTINLATGKSVQGGSLG